MSINLASTLNCNQSLQTDFHVGSRIIIQPEHLSSSCQHLAYATGEIKKIKGTSASVLLDELSDAVGGTLRDHRPYKAHIVHLELSWLVLAAPSQPGLDQDTQTDINDYVPQRENSNLRIDPEFKNLIPPLSPSEKLQLEANLKEFGCIDPLVVWQGMDIILDGHNRYEICTRLQIPYKIVSVEIADREAAICWIANHQLGRRNITFLVGSYLRGKRYLHLKGDRLDNLRQNSPKCKICTSEEDGIEEDFQSGENVMMVDKAKILSKEYKVSVRTIKNDAEFTSALDCLATVLGEELKHSILARTAKLTKAEILSLAEITRNQGQEAAQKMLSSKMTKSDIVQRIKDKQRLPNPHYIGEVCRIISKGNPDLKQFSGCWCIIFQVNLHSCGIKTWKKDFENVKPENLDRTYGACEEMAAQNCDRIRRLAEKIYKNFDHSHAAVVEVLGKFVDPSSLTLKQTRILTFLENEYFDKSIRNS
jgi:hypothetical protein